MQDVKSQVYCNTIEADFWDKYVLIYSDTKYGDDIWYSLKHAKPNMVPVPNTLLKAGLYEFNQSLV